MQRYRVVTRDKGERPIYTGIPVSWHYERENGDGGHVYTCDVNDDYCADFEEAINLVGGVIDCYVIDH
jgi:hypothetical protein